MRIYLDHQSSTPVLPEVAEAMRPFFGKSFGNASSLHAVGIAARDAIEQARERVSKFLGAESAESIIFTGNGTEAVNLAIKGVAYANQGRGKHIVLSAAEHPATNRSVAWLESLGFSSTVVPVDKVGRIDAAAVEAALTPETILVCVHHVNHDLGTIQEVGKIGEITSKHGAFLFVDAIGSAGWLSIDVEKMRADLLAISPHRFYGPKGVGVLYRHRRARIESLIHGGEQENGYRAGTENVAAIVGAGVAAEIGARDLSARAEHTARLQRKVFEALTGSIEFIKLNGPPPGPFRHPAQLNFSIEFIDGEALGLMLDVKGVAVGTSTACVARNLRIPAALAAIGLAETLAKGTVLLSLGKDHTDAEIDVFVPTFIKTVSALREMSPAWEDFQKGLIGPELPRCFTTACQP